MAHEHHHGSHSHGGDGGLAELLDLDAEVLTAYQSELTEWIAQLTGDRRIAHILDLGAGTGTGTFALLRRFGGAHVTAVDASGEMLRRLAGNARRHGLAERVRTLVADLDEQWPPAPPADLIWASSSMHHLADPDRVLAEIRAGLTEHGLFAMVEMETMPRFLTGGAGAELEARLHAARDRATAELLPHLGADWSARLSAAGLKVYAERTFTIELTTPLPAAAGRYAQATLARMRERLAESLSPDDVAALDALIGDGPDSVRRRPDLTVRGERKAWIAGL